MVDTGLIPPPQRVINMTLIPLPNGHRYEVETYAPMDNIRPIPQPWRAIAWGWNLCHHRHTFARPIIIVRLTHLPQLHMKQISMPPRAINMMTIWVENQPHFYHGKNILRHWFISSSVKPYIWGWYPHHDGNNYEAKLPQCATWSTTGEMYKGR